MRKLSWMAIVAITLLLSGCVSSVLIGSQLQSKLMYAFIKPLVGFDPSDIHFFDAPIIKDRMTALLGDKYEHAMVLLNTAHEIQQEGALFYVLSRYAPSPVRDAVNEVKDTQNQVLAVADRAGMVWNAETNQLAVLLVQDGTPQVVSEQIANAKEALTPKLPAELQSVYDQALAAKATADAAKQKVESLKQQAGDAQQLLQAPEDPLLKLIQQKEAEALDKAEQ